MFGVNCYVIVTLFLTGSCNGFMEDLKEDVKSALNSAKGYLGKKKL